MAKKGEITPPRKRIIEKMWQGFVINISHVAGNGQALFFNDGGDVNHRVVRRIPDDVGVAVYFTYRRKPMCFACDLYERIEDNIHAIGLTIEALRGIARWGTGDMMERAFTGFAALPAPAKRAWWDVLGVDRLADRETIRTVYRARAKLAHPDGGGSDEQMAELSAAYQEAMAA